MPKSSLALRYALIPLLTLLIATPCAADGTFHVMLRDGEQISGETMHFWHGGQETKLDDRPLFHLDNPPRVIRRNNATVRLSGPFVEFRNGDLLPGRATRYLTSASTDSSASLAVALPERSPLVAVASGEVRVRADQVRVIVLDSRRRLLRYTPGAALFRDGRQFQCRAVRVTDGGLLLLTDQGLLNASFSELSELHLPDREWNVTETQLRWLRWAEENMLLESLVLTNGARLTIPQGMTEMETHYRSERFAFCALQPGWSLDTLYFDPEHAAVSLYRQLNEVPLSLLPTETIAQQSTLHNWPWRRDRTVHGDLLAAGPLTVSEGFGVHGNTTLAISLPATAESLSGWAGIDRTVGVHGAMKCSIMRDAVDGEVLWQSDLLRGGEPPRQFGPLTISGAKRIMLATDELTTDAGPTADPLDIGDDLCWLLTTVTLAPETAQLDRLANNSLGHWIPELAGWSVAEDSRRVQLRPVWSEEEDRWRYSLGFRDGENESGQIRLVRRIQVTLENAFLEMSAASMNRHAAHEVGLSVNGVRVGSTMNGDIKTNRRPGDFDSRLYILDEHAGQAIELVMRIEKADMRPSGSGVFFQAAMLGPLVKGLPAGGKPIEPDMPLTKLAPIKSEVNGEPWQPQADGGVNEKTPLNIRGYPLAEGFATPEGVSLTYDLRPEWSRFVAVIGLADGWKGAGPYEVYYDGVQHWISSDPAEFSRNKRGQQINVPIPEGSKTITLRMGGRESWGAWGHAGFLRE